MEEVKIIVISILLLLCLGGCCDRDDDDIIALNRCAYQQSAELCELKKRVRELEWKVKSLRYEQQQEFDDYKKMAEEYMKERKWKQ